MDEFNLLPMQKDKIVLFFVFAFFLIILYSTSCEQSPNPSAPSILPYDTSQVYLAPDTSFIPDNYFGNQIRYGRDLIVRTAYYIGPRGKLGSYTRNLLNCQSCHLEAGTKPYAFNLISTHGRYPQYRAREDRILTLSDRINNCIMRPMSGKPLPNDSKELVAMSAYIMWLGQNIPVGWHVKGDEGLEFDYLDRAADPRKGEIVYNKNCAKCHGINGAGVTNAEGDSYIYPPLWGDESYQAGSSIHRVDKAARFIYANMPNENNTRWDNPKLSIEEAYDVAAFVNDDRIHQRPVSKEASGYPNPETKPIDYGTGPYIDTFSEEQHKFGPYQPIIDYRKAHKQPIRF